MPVRSNVRRINKFDAEYNPETIKQSIEQQYESLIDEPVAWQAAQHLLTGG